MSISNFNVVFMESLEVNFRAEIILARVTLDLDPKNDNLVQSTDETGSSWKYLEL